MGLPSPAADRPASLGTNLYPLASLSKSEPAARIRQASNYEEQKELINGGGDNHITFCSKIAPAPQDSQCTTLERNQPFVESYLHRYHLLTRKYTHLKGIVPECAVLSRLTVFKALLLDRYRTISPQKLAGSVFLSSLDGRSITFSGTTYTTYTRHAESDAVDRAWLYPVYTASRKRVITACSGCYGAPPHGYRSPCGTGRVRPI